MAVPMPDESATAPIPAPLTSLVGREREVDEVCALLKRVDVRLLTLTGPGGVGKTRLAMAAAVAVARDFGDGVRFVPFAAVRDAGHVPALLARAVGVRELADRPFAEQVRAVAERTNALLLVDNFEHLLPAAPVIVELLSACPGVTVLVTSRERLRVSGEWDVPVPPLACPNPDRLPALEQVASAPAVRLFVERARAANPNFTLAESNAAAVVAICHRLDGLPLALELAAARGPHLPPAALLARLARRLPLLTGGPRDVPSRLQTMRDAIGWSHDLLTETEQVVFRRVASFVGGCTLEAAEVVVGETPEPDVDAFEVIAALVDASLLWQESTLGTEPRYFMLETVREFGLEALAHQGELAFVRDRHASCFLALAEEAEPNLRGPEQVAWLDRLDLELPNLRAALSWLHESGSLDRGLRLAAALWTFWVVRDRVPEGRRWLDVLLALSAPELPERLPAMIALGDMCERQGDYAGATRWTEEALELARLREDRGAEAAALRGLGNISIARFEVALLVRGNSLEADEEYARARVLLEQSLSLAVELGDEWAVAKALNWMAVAWKGKEVEAIGYAEDAAARFRTMGDWRQLCNVQWILGGSAQSAGDPVRAQAAFLESLALARMLGYRWHCGLCLTGLAMAASSIGEFERAAWLLGASETIREPTGEPLRPTVQVSFDTAADAARQGIGEARYKAAFSAGAATPPEEAISQVLAGSGTEAGPPGGLSQPAAGDSLTLREIDVLRLVVEGRSDRAIADALFISRRTASKHVAAILAKLGATTRTEAAARAVREGLA